MNEEQAGAGTGPGEGASPPATLPRARLRIAGIVFGAVVTIAVGIGALLFVQHQRDTAAAEESAVPPSWQRPAVSTEGLVERSGVEIVHVAVTGGGGLLDVRFKVVDPDKAGDVHDEGTPPAIVDEATGLVDSQLLMDHAHSGPMKQAVTYYLVFENTGEWVKRGSTVSVLLGDAQVEHVTVQ